MACYFNDKKVLPLADFSQTDSFDSRKTANGEKILSPSFALVEKIKGKTVKSTNLIPFPYSDPRISAYGGTFTEQGLTWTVNEDRSITVVGTVTGASRIMLSPKIPVQKGKTYVFSMSDKSFLSLQLSLDIIGTNSDGTTTTVANWSLLNNYLLLSITGDFENFVSISLAIKRRTNDVEVNATLYPMLVEDSTAQPYTPYFAGLKNATVLGIKSTGTNLFDIDNPILAAIRESDKAQYSPKIENGVIYNGGIYGRSRGIEIAIPVKKNTDYIFSFNAAVDESIPERYAQLIGISGLDSNNVYSSSATISSIIQVKNGSNVLTVNSGDWEYIGMAVWAKTQYSIAITNLQIRRGSSATDYQPYTENTYQLPESYELGEWDYLNPIEKTITRGTRTITFNGTETFTNAISRFGEVIYSITGSNKMNTAFNECISNFSNKVVLGNTGGSAIAFQVDKSSTMEEFKATLANAYADGNPITVVYPLAEPTTETIECPRGYTAHKDGTETYLAGETDNSEWGAIPEFTLNYPKIMKEGTFNG